MGTLLTTEEIEQQFHHLAQGGAYDKALELITREAHLFPAYSQKVVYSWRMTMACRLNNRTLALQILKEAVTSGYWIDGLRDDPDYQSLQNVSEFNQLVEICEERRAQEMINAVPVLKTLQPDPMFNPYPLLLALHGAQSNAESFASHWSAAVLHGWFVGLPQSSQAYGPGTYSWNDWAWALQEVQKHFVVLCTGYPIDPQRVVLAGFSQGGGLAAWLGLGGVIKVHGLILVGPFLPDVNELIPLLEKYDSEGIRVYIAAGQRDKYCYEVAQQLARLLPHYGIGCKLDVYADLEHNFPVDFERKLPEALNYCASMLTSETHDNPPNPGC